MRFSRRVRKMILELRELGSATVIVARGSVRAEDNRRFAEVLRGLRTSGCRVILDAAELDYVNSRALGEIVRFVQEVRPKGGELVVVSPRPLVKKIIKAVGLLSLVRVCESVEEAAGLWER